MSSSILWEQFENDHPKSRKAKKQDKQDRDKEVKVKKKKRAAVLYGSPKK
jgi:hypothetical protein